ncbi:MAG: N-formylglutamate amidohydrolase [Rhodothermaceae bacterium]|nr:N-formylglutamate amidohydrolase [Rhodothermaceae bacterium]
MTAPSVILTCEHGGYEVPDDLKSLFEGYSERLKSHRGWDPGALDLTLGLSEKLGYPVFFSEISRLVVELNRSEHNRALFSDITDALPKAKREHILEEYYYPFRKKVFSHISRIIQQGGFVIHFSVHTFSPEVDGKIRNADTGLLYDPARKSERDVAVRIAEALKQHSPHIRTRMNYPYTGKADGHATALRKSFGPGEYAGLELEINQQLVVGSDAGTSAFHDNLACAIKHSLTIPLF